MQNVQTGMFKLPGISFENHEVNEEITNAMETWADEVNCGMKIGDRLWSFTDESQRDFFILRWSDSLLKLDEDADNQTSSWQSYLDKVSKHVMNIGEEEEDDDDDDDVGTES